MLTSAGLHCNHKRAHRLYKELKLNINVKPKKRLALRTKKEICIPNEPNQSWSLDYMSDALISGQVFRTANCIDDYNREALGIYIDFSLPSIKITHWLDFIASIRGYPKAIRADNGPENIAANFKQWAVTHNVRVDYIQPGKPAQNALIERFNRSYREEILDMYLFDSISHVRQLTDEWIEHYNNVRPHQSLMNMPPKVFSLNLSDRRLGKKWGFTLLASVEQKVLGHYIYLLYF